jgi:hypothetical protein
MSNLQRKLKVVMERYSNLVLVKQYGKKELPLEFAMLVFLFSE